MIFEVTMKEAAKMKECHNNNALYITVTNTTTECSWFS